MEHQQIIDTIKAKEKEAQGLIDKAKEQAAVVLREVKTARRKEYLDSAQKEAAAEIQRLQEEFRRKGASAIEEINQAAKKEANRINQIASKNKDKTVKFIVEEVLRLWQSQK